MQQAVKTTRASTQSLPPVLNRLEYCLRKGCFFCVEHSANGSWKMWDRPNCYNGDLGEISSAIEQCREVNSDKLIRLSIEDFSFRSRFTVMVHDPAANES